MCIIDVEDYRGERVTFSQKKLEEKSKQHPELKKTAFIARVKTAITDPDYVWEDYGDKKNRRCYYRKYSTTTYVKVVVWVTSKPCVVVTAYEIDKIKEEHYSGLKQLK